MEKVSHGPCVRNEKSSLSQKGQCLSFCDVLSSLEGDPLVQSEALKSPPNVPTQTALRPHYSIYARPPQGGTWPSNNDKMTKRQNDKIMQILQLDQHKPNTFTILHSNGQAQLGNLCVDRML